MEFFESQINQISFPTLLTTRLLSSLASRSLCARLAPLPLVLGSTYNHPKVILFNGIIFVYLPHWVSLFFIVLLLHFCQRWRETGKMRSPGQNGRMKNFQILPQDSPIFSPGFQKIINQSLCCDDLKMLLWCLFREAIVQLSIAASSVSFLW